MFDMLKEGLDDIVLYQKGKKKLRVNEVYIPEPPKTYSSKEVKKIRTRLGCSQATFARLLNVSPKTIQSWESGQRHPASSSLRLLEFFDDPSRQSQLMRRISR